MALDQLAGNSRDTHLRPHVSSPSTPFRHRHQLNPSTTCLLVYRSFLFKSEMSCTSTIELPNVWPCCAAGSRYIFVVEAISLAEYLDHSFHDRDWDEETHQLRIVPMIYTSPLSITQTLLGVIFKHHGLVFGQFRELMGTIDYCVVMLDLTHL